MKSVQPELIHQGKVRDVYKWNDELLLIASDRISAFDVILPTPIPGKGILLTAMSRFWFERFQSTIAHHVLSYDLPSEIDHPEWHGRITRCKPATPLPIECIVRGYLTGSAWNEYRQHGTIQGFTPPPGLRESEPLPEPLFTPSTKAKAGHDQPLTETEARELLGSHLYETVRTLSLDLYRMAHEYALSKGIILADTKLEFGHHNGALLLIDEIFTPDSSRYWPQNEVHPGSTPPAFDKQYVRDYLKSLPDWNGQAPGPPLPPDVVEGTRLRYLEAFQRITGHTSPSATTQ